MRQDTDYEDFITITKEEVKKIRHNVKAFIFIEESKSLLSRI